MKRYYLSRIVGSGTRTDPWRTRAADLATAAGGATASAIPAQPVAGGWALTVVECLDHTALLADPNLKALPDIALDIKVSAIQTATKNRMTSDIAAVGIDTTSLGNADGYRDVLRLVGRAYEPAFDENAFDAPRLT